MARERQTRRKSENGTKALVIPNVTSTLLQEKAQHSTKISPVDKPKLTNADLNPTEYKKYRLTMLCDDSKEWTNKSKLWGQRRFKTIVECAEFINRLAAEHGLDRKIHYNAFYDIAKYSHTNPVYNMIRYEVLNKDGTVKEVRESPREKISRVRPLKKEKQAEKNIISTDFSDTDLAPEESDTEGDYSVDSDDVAERLEELQNAIDTEKREKAFAENGEKPTLQEWLKKPWQLVEKKPEEKSADELVDEYQPIQEPAAPIPGVKTPTAGKRIVTVIRPVSYKKNRKSTTPKMIKIPKRQENSDEIASLRKQMESINSLLVQLLAQK